MRMDVLEVPAVNGGWTASMRDKPRGGRENDLTKKKKGRRGEGEGEERRMTRRASLTPVVWTARTGRGKMTSWCSCCGWCGCRWEQSTKSDGEAQNMSPCDHFLPCNSRYSFTIYDL